MKPGRKPRSDSRFTTQAALLASILRQARDTKGSSQQAVAMRSGVSLSWLTKLERGDITEPGLFPVLAVLKELGAIEEIDTLLNAQTSV